MTFKELKLDEFRAQLKQDQEALLIDVREEYEFEDANIGGKNIPMGEIISRIEELKNKNLFLYCKSGKRSKTAALHLSKKLNDSNIYTLIGGLQAYNINNG